MSFRSLIGKIFISFLLEAVSEEQSENLGKSLPCPIVFNSSTFL